jgi:hypothetical protein
LISEEVYTSDKEKIRKYLKVLNIEMQTIQERHVHVFSKIFDSSTNKPLPRSITPVIISYFGDPKSANSKCVYLASIYNTLLDNAAINNDMNINPEHLKNMKIDYISPEKPIMHINKNSHIFKMIAFLICTLYLCIMYKFKYQTNIKHLVYSFLSLLTIIFVTYHLYKFLTIKFLSAKAMDIMKVYGNQHHACHDSCKKMFDDTMKYKMKDQLYLMKDLDENILSITNYKNVNKLLILNGIASQINSCNFSCGNSNIILTNNVYNNDGYNTVPFYTITLLDSLSHLYFLSDQTETDRKEYNDNINRYFDINVL